MSTLDNLKKEAKRWLKALRTADPSARARLDRAYAAAPADPVLRDVQHALAREHGHESWIALLDAVARRAPRPIVLDTSGGRTHDERVATFLTFACWDHHTHGKADHRMYDHAASRLLAQHPEIAHDSLYTAIVCGDLRDVERRLAENPAAAREAGGARGWTPILYLSYTRFTHRPAIDNAAAIGRALLDHGANPNDFYMAGDSHYTTLTGVAGEGEQDSPRQPQSAALFQLLLERGAEPFDIQVLYNTHFSGDVRWWLDLIYTHTQGTPRAAAWTDPLWPMLDMGGYGSGARFLLWIAIEKQDLALAQWVLERGANPNAPPARDRRFSKRSLYEDALRQGADEIAALLLRHGATPVTLELSEEEAFIAACLRVDRAAARAAIDRHPAFLSSTHPIFAAVRRDAPEAVALLLDLGVSIEIADQTRQRPLHVAAAHDARRVAELLIARGAEIDPRELRFDGTPIGFAAHHDHLAMLDLLSRYSRNVWTLTFRGYVDRVRTVLVEEPALARATQRDGTTPLWWLPDDEEKAEALAALFLAHGADASTRNPQGATAIDWALKRGMRGVARLLAEAAAAGPRTTVDADADADPDAAADEAANETGEETAQETEEAAPPLMTGSIEEYDRIAQDLSTVYATGDAAALARLQTHYRVAFTPEDVRANVWRRVRTVREAQGAADAFTLPISRDLVAREAGFGGWDALAKAIGAGAPLPPAYAVDAAAGSIAPRRNLSDADWDAIIGVMQERRLTRLDASGQMTDAVLARVAALDHVTSLSLGGSRMLTDDGLRHLARMPQLEELDLSEYPGGVLTDRGLDVLRALPSLRRFEMCWQRGISDAGIAHLAACEQLEQVNLLGSPTGDGAIAALRGKRHLRRLQTGRLVTDAGLSALRDIPAFATWMGGEPVYGLMAYEARPTHLRLDGPFTNAGLRALAALDGLSGLSFFWHVSAMTPDGLAALTSLPRLGFLGVEGALCDDVAMRHIAAMPNLRMLMGQGTVASDEGFEALSRSRTLEYIWGKECPNLTGRGFRALARLPTLRGMALSCKGVDEASLARLPEFPALRELMPMDVEDAGFRHVGRCAALERLICMYCREITDRATEQIGGLAQLRYYYAGAARIGDRSLEILGDLSALEEVEIYQCEGVSDAGLPFLARLPRLRKVSLSGLPRVTRDGLAAFPEQVRVDYWP